MTIATEISTRNAGHVAPPPAGSAATEDGGQRYLEETSEAMLSDKYPAGLAVSPPEPVRDNRGMRIDVRYTTAERAAVCRRAQVLGIKPSAWVRAAVLDALDARREHVAAMERVASSVPSPELAKAVEQVRRVGVNLNTALRDGRAVDDDMLRAVLATVNEVRAQLGDRTAL